jgi:uncharacterized protein YoxC
LSSAFDWAVVLDIGVGLVGLGVLIAGIGVFRVCSSLATTATRLNKTLDEVDQQIGALSGPVIRTLDHVGGIANTADATVARLGAVVGTLESVADGVGKTARVGSEALQPAFINIGAALTGVTAGLRRLVTRGRPASNGVHMQSSDV